MMPAFSVRTSLLYREDAVEDLAKDRGFLYTRF